MKKQHLLILSILVIVAGAGILLSPKKTQQHVVKIGAIYPLTGPASSLGQEFERGARIAVEEAQVNGMPISLSVEDAKTDVPSAIAAYEKLRSEGVQFMLTTVSGISLALEARARQDGILLFADAAHPDITGKSPLIFRHSSTAQQEAEAIYSNLAEKKANRLALLWQNDDYGASFNRAFVELASSEKATALVHNSSYLRDDPEPRNTIAPALETNPSHIILIGSGATLGHQIAGIRESGYRGTIIAGMGFTVTPDAIIAAGKAASGVIHTYMIFDKNEPMFRRFATSYEKRYHVAPPSFSVLAYNSTRLIIESINASSNDPKDVAVSILSKEILNGAGGPISIKPNGDLLPQVGLKTFEE